MAGRQPAGAPRRPRLHLQVEHGLDARHARVRARGSGPPPLAAQPRHVLDALRVHRELRPAVLARRSRARQGRAARQDAGRRVAEVRDAAHALRLHVRASRARSCCSWAASSASGASGTTTAASTGTCSTIRRTRACSATSRRSTGTTAPSRRCTSATSIPSGFRWIDCNDNENSVVSFVRYARDRRDFVVMVFNFTPVPRAGLPHRRARARAATPSCSTATARSTAAATSATAAASPTRADRRARLRPVVSPDRPAARLPAAEEALTDCTRTKTRSSKSRSTKFRSSLDLVAMSDRTRALAVALVTLATFTDLLAYSIAVPVLPDLSRRLGASPTMIGLLFASFGVTLLAVSIPMGAISDRIGRELPLVGRHGGARGVDAAVRLRADALPWLFAARLRAGRRRRRHLGRRLRAGRRPLRRRTNAAA